MIKRIVKEGQQAHGVNERLAYKVITTPWGSTPTSVSVSIFDVTAGAYTNVTTSVTTGSETVSGDEITTRLIHSLTLDHLYWVMVRFTCAGNVFECIIPVKCER
jgi:hypothetical protein